MMKKLIATALAAAMIFGLVSVALAASVDLPDVDGYEWEKEVRRLASLGIIDGYEDGTFKPDNTVKRSEFAKMIVCMLGLENAANLLKGEAGPFSDVAGTHWASGYINVAEMKGIVGGYPDGTFKPEGTITYAEALKMILAAMGYLEDGFLVVRWPVTWIIQATEVGLDDGVEVLANLPISRGEVAKIFDNSLTKAHVKIGEHDFEKRDPEVSFMGKLGVKSFVGQVTDSPELWDSKTSGKVAVVGKDKDGKELPAETFAVENYEGLLGHKVKVWYKGSNVLAVEDLSTEKIVTLKQYKDLANPGRYILNHTVSDKTAVDDLVENDNEDLEITVVYEGSKPIAVKAAKYETGKVSDVYAYGSTRKDLYLSDASDGRSKLALAGFEVEYQGAAEGFSDIKKDDVVQYIIDNTPDIERAFIVVVRDVYKGTLTEVTSSDKMKVDGKVFEPANTTVSDTAKAQVGSVVTLYLNKDGKVFSIKVDKAYETTETFYGVVQGTSTRLVKGERKTFADILTVDGEVEYDCTGQEDVTVGNVVYGVIGGDDKVTFTKITATGPIAVTEVDTTNKKLNDTYFYTDKTLWLEVEEGSYNTRPRPYKDDEVTLYVAAGKVVVGIVE